MSSNVTAPPCGDRQVAVAAVQGGVAVGTAPGEATLGGALKREGHRVSELENSSS